jgi:hypothetical protein
MLITSNAGIKTACTSTKHVTKWRYEGQIRALGVHVSIALVINVHLLACP